MQALIIPARGEFYTLGGGARAIGISEAYVYPMES